MNFADDRISDINMSAKTTIMIATQINARIKKINFGTSVSNLVEVLNLTDKKIALEVNGEIIPRSQFDSRILEDGDQIEIVTAVGGG